tara:strand:- start:20001 stop:21104 length:1104 start_codon:yes stop_codon:yes gene_type:complete
MNILVYILIASVGVLSGAGGYGYIDARHDLQNSQEELRLLKSEKDVPATFSSVEGMLGAATASNDFPNTLSNVQDDDIIQAGDWNHIEYALGTMTSEVTTSTNYLLRSTSSLNPGHFHNSASVSGTQSIATGGTATSSYRFRQGLVTASGTNALSSLVTMGDGSLAIGNGSSWSVGTLTSGAGINISNASGSITITNSATVSASSTKILIASTTFSTATTSLVSQTFTTTGYKNLEVEIFLMKQTTGGGHILVFNNATGTQEYGWRFSENGAAQATGGNTAGIVFAGSDPNTSSTFTNAIVNQHDSFSQINFQSVQTASTTAYSGGIPDYIVGAGHWASTTPITSIGIVAGGGASFPPGSYIKVFGF